MNYLIVLCGPVACGKSTLIKRFLEQNPDFVFVDVFNYIQKYKDKTGHIKPSGSLAAHQEMHRDLAAMDQNIILEIGTNREELNIGGINNLKDKFAVKIIFCLLDKETCIKRVMDRALENQKRVINPLDLEAKFKRPFPANHLNLAISYSLPLIKLDMSASFEERLEILVSLINGSRTVVALAAIKDNKILLVRKKETWILPGGQPKPGESDLQCLTREIAEELPELEIINPKFYKTFAGQTPNTGDTITLKLYFADFAGKIKPAAEINKADWFGQSAVNNFSDLTRRIIDSLVRDGYLR